MFSLGQCASVQGILPSFCLDDVFPFEEPYCLFDLDDVHPFKEFYRLFDRDDVHPFKKSYRLSDLDDHFGLLRKK